MKRLANLNVVITGATRGIGKGIAELFVRQGASIAIIGTNEEKGKSNKNNKTIHNNPIQYFIPPLFKRLI